MIASYESPMRLKWRKIGVNRKQNQATMKHVHSLHLAKYLAFNLFVAIHISLILIFLFLNFNF